MFNIVAINTSSTKPPQLAYSLKYDTVYRTFKPTVEAKDDTIVVDGTPIKCYNHRNPEEIPWGDHNVDVVIDCTGVFKDREGLSKHIHDTVKKVILTVPPKEDSIKTVVLGANDSDFDFAGTDIISNASCTTNCAALMTEVLDKEFGIESGFLTTTHAYTSSQALVDAPQEKTTRGRAAALSIIPTTTGASKAVCLVTSLEQKHLAGLSIRVPTPVGSLTDMVCLLKKEATIEAINAAFKKAAEGSMKGYLGYETVELVSSDYIGNSNSCTFDANYTDVVGGKLVKILGWYDNEWGYSSRIVDLVKKIEESMS